MKVRALDQIRRDYAEFMSIGQMLRETFGLYRSVVIEDDGERVFSWERDEAFKPVTNHLPANRKPHLWTDKERV